MKNSKNTRKAAHGLNIKDTDRNKTNVVYKVTFDDGKIYIGSTVEKLSTRINKMVDAGRHLRQQDKITKRINTLCKAGEVASVTVLEKVSGSTQTLRDTEYSHIQDAYSINSGIVLNSYSVEEK